ncbi:MAG: hypothetical protein K8W52_14400 [Deltaproteobacteria bacterium]|nr:hypothetical protein [Deltaproteobacteria bacterium]
MTIVNRTSFLFAALALAACGPGGSGTTVDADPAHVIDADPAHLTPMLIPGGGVSTGPVSGSLAVYVIQPGGSTPIAGAQVRIGAADAAAPLTATTDATGLALFMDASLTGPQTITATATGRAAATWIGVTGANTTIPLAPLPNPVQIAKASGTITGWDSLPAPSSFSHYNLAVILSTFTDDVGGPENNITQPTASGTPVNTCLTTAVSADPCAWQLVTRTGQQRHVAVIVDGNTNGTSNDTTDDTYTLIGYAIGPSATLTANQQVTGENLAILPANQLASFQVSFPAAPAGLPTQVAIPMLDLGADGRIPFPLPTITPSKNTIQVIKNSGAYAGSYMVVGLATPSTTKNTPYSTTIAAAATSPATLGAWLPAPTQVTGTGGAYAFTAAAGATLHSASFARADGATIWTVSLLDGSSSFHLPALTPDPLGTGALKLTVTAADVPGFDAAGFTVDELTTGLRRAAGATASITH